MKKITKEAWKVFGGLFPMAATKILFYKAHQHRRLRLSAPELFDEKINYLKLFTYANDPVVAKCADKYAVREYVAAKGWGHVLNDLYGVWNSPDEVPFDAFPDKFVLKCTHGCHMNIVCTKKSDLDKESAKKQLDVWMHDKIWNFMQEFHYRLIPPRIICEKYIETRWGGDLPPDYKILCFNGVPKVVMLATNRDPHDESRVEFTFRDLDWNLLEIGNGPINTTLPRPSCFNEMLECAKSLSADFPFVRVDFYEIDGRLLFGEMTFVPAGGNAKYYTMKGQELLGSMLKLP
jgi:hypothetical protein